MKSFPWVIKIDAPSLIFSRSAYLPLKTKVIGNTDILTKNEDLVLLPEGLHTTMHRTRNSPEYNNNTGQ